MSKKKVKEILEWIVAICALFLPALLIGTVIYHSLEAKIEDTEKRLKQKIGLSIIDANFSLPRSFRPFGLRTQKSLTTDGRNGGVER